jgi:O-antigen ligase
VAWTAEWPLANDRILYGGYWRSPFQVFGPLFVSLPGISLFPWQLMLLAFAPLCLLRPGAFHKRGWAMDAAIVTSVASVALTFLWGWMRGGSPYNAYYQLWRFLTALLVGLLLLSVIRNSRDVRALGLTILMAALVRGTLAIYFYWAHVRGRLPSLTHMTTHDDSLLFVAGLLVMLSWALARGKPAAWLGVVPLSIPLLYAITLNNRRLAWIELVLVLAFMYLLVSRRRLGRRLKRYLLAVAPVLLVYLVVGWDRPGAAFAPVRALSTAGSNDDASSLARQEEVRNLLYTLSANGNPLLGTGWGMPYQKVSSVYSNFGAEWWQYAYLPHNSLLAVAVFGGLVGICGIWLVIPVAAFLATRGYRGATQPAHRAAAMAALCILPAYAAQCYGDIGFQSLTCALIVGVAMGVAGKVSAWAGALPEGARRSAAHTGAPVRAAPVRPWTEDTPRFARRSFASASDHRR